MDDPQFEMMHQHLSRDHERAKSNFSAKLGKESRLPDLRSFFAAQRFRQDGSEQKVGFYVEDARRLVGRS